MTQSASKQPPPARSTGRYKGLTEGKVNGVTYTPKVLADFVAEQIVGAADFKGGRAPLCVLDPAVGDGELLLSLLAALRARTKREVVVYGFDTEEGALRNATRRLLAGFPDVTLRLQHGSFLHFASDYAAGSTTLTLFPKDNVTHFDLIIANPPYVRTQIMGADIARGLVLAAA